MKAEKRLAIAASLMALIPFPNRWTMGAGTIDHEWKYVVSGGPGAPKEVPRGSASYSSCEVPLEVIMVGYPGRYRDEVSPAEIDRDRVKIRRAGGTDAAHCVEPAGYSGVMTRCESGGDEG